MAEEFNPAETGRQIAAEYLSKRLWARERRRLLDRLVYPAFQREELEEKEREIDRLEQEAEDNFSQSVERWRHSVLPQKNEVLKAVLRHLRGRTDLGYFARRIVQRLEHEAGPV
ncbi:MAG: hypothetical protein JW782_05105 [Candidatus Saganbacteria bacterium]|nr:hypothetical protein [Candidatus Saganbacteria bacterium]